MQLVGLGPVGGEGRGALGGLAGVVEPGGPGGFEGAGQVVEDIGAIGELAGGNPEVGDGRFSFTQGQAGAAAEEVGFGIVGRQLDDLIEPGQGLLGAVAGELQGRDPSHRGGRGRVELQGAEAGGQRVLGAPEGLERLGAGEVGLGTARVKLDGGVQMLQGRGEPAATDLHLTEADQGRGVLRIMLQGTSVRGLGQIEPTLGFPDPAESLVDLGREGLDDRQALEDPLRLGPVAAVHRSLGGVVQIAAEPKSLG